jgi:pSer/pThr/pTyr-binding forkhead associated (FHA) protein
VTASAQTWRLALRVFKRGSTGDDVVVFHKSEVVIGSTSPADLVLHDCNVSRKHCKLSVDDDGLVWITDLGSTNGIWVNGGRVDRAHFVLGDILMTGNYLIRLADLPTRVPE